MGGGPARNGGQSGGRGRACTYCIDSYPATRYGAIQELEDYGWIEELTDARRPVDESQRKRYYRITRFGRAAVAAETERLAAVVRVARTRVKPRAGETS